MFDDLLVQNIDSSSDWESTSVQYTDSNSSDADPFADANAQKEEKDKDAEQIPIREINH